MRRLHYKQDYISYWKEKGEYGQIRVNRMLKRKRERWERHLENKKNYARRYGGFWKGDDGKLWQFCEWPEGSICEYPCNGDC